MKNTFSINILLIVLFLFIGSKGFGQMITGQTPVQVGQTRTYTYVASSALSSPTWIASKGSVVSTNVSGLTYTAEVFWNSAGSGVVSIKPPGLTVYATMNVTVNAAATPSTPNPTFSTTYNCGNTVITRSTSPASTENYEWWWQTASNGTSTTLGSGPSITRTTSGNLYLRARLRLSPNTWSSNSQTVGNITVYTTAPPVPTTSTAATVFPGGSATLTVGVASGATSYKWYTVSSGGTAEAQTVTPSYTVNNISVTTYYVSSLAGTCESTGRKSISITIEPNPQIIIIGGGALGEPMILGTSGAYLTYLWKDASGQSLGTSPTLSVTQLGTYTVTVTKSGVAGYGTSQGFAVSFSMMPQNMNYIVSNTIKAEGITSVSVVDQLTADNNSQTIQYFDGIGRPIQSVNTQASPLKKDIIQPVVYDALGREFRKYLPVVTGTNDGWYKTITYDATGNYTGQAANFYSNNASGKIAQDTRPFSETVFEPSPLNRVSKNYGPGQDWSTSGNNKFTEQQYLVNVHATSSSNSAEKVIAWKLDATGMPVRYDAATNIIEVGGYSSSNQLVVNKSIDENQNAVREYTNKQGQVILKKVQAATAGTADLNNTNNWALTYYIYDDFGNLRYVFPPELSKLIHASADNYVVTTDNLNNWAFQYKYDARKRMTHKKVPGAEPVFMVYDNRDRVVLTQDGNQRPLKQWMYTKYDILNRPIMAGIYTHGSEIDQPAMSGLVSTTVFYETFNVSQPHGYTTTAGYFPSTNLQVLTATYYDNYNFKSMTSGLDYVSTDLPGQYVFDPIGSQKNFPRVIGQVTGTKVNILGTSNYLYTASYFDDKQRAVQIVSQNHKSGTDHDLSTNKFNFSGQVTETKRTYIVSGVTRTVKETFTYDHAGRLLTVKHSTNGAADVMIVKNDYNELGQLVDKQLHSTDNGVTFKQSVDYRFNIRGWLTKINEGDISTVANGEILGDYFGMELGYNNTISGITSNGVYNGNISAMKWSTGAVDAANLQGNAYDYDPLNRLNGSSHYKSVAGSLVSDNSNLETGFSYDLNGNILALTRKGDLASTIDNLTYNYTGNQLNYVNDAGDVAKGFVNGNTGTDDYAYDANGNLIKDKNKGIANNNDIKYNHLNLPTEVIKGADKVKYYYDATGLKLYQELYTGASVTKTTDYIGELIFENNTLQFINTSEGRVLPDGANWEYQYHLKDHLGNVRTTFTAKTPVVVNMLATMETENATSENAMFSNIAPRVVSVAANKTAGGNEVIRLNNTRPVGVSKSLSVMPGDVINLEVYAYYEGGGGYSSSLGSTTLITAVASAFGGVSGGIGESGKIFSGVNSGIGALGLGGTGSDNEPAAFLNYILFDKNYNFITGGFKRITSAANFAKEYLNLNPITVKEAGYIFVYVSNESNTSNLVSFDDLKISHTPSAIVGVNDYYPFGLTFNSYSRENSLSNQFLYNGKEKQDELELNTYDFGARQYDPAVGRWNVIDPLADKRLWMTPYNYVQNNPLIRFDPDGLTDFTLNRKTGEMQEVKYDDEQKQKENTEAKDDRIVKTNRKGEIKYKKNGEAKTAVGSIEKGILKDGVNFQNKDNVIAVGGEGQASVGGVIDFALKLSNYVGKEIGGQYLSAKGQNAISNIYIGRYVNNDAQNEQSPFTLYSLRPDLLGNVDIKADFHTHLSRFDDNDRLRPSSLGPTGGDEGYKRRQLRINPSMRFIIITNPSSTDQRATEIEY